MGLTKIIYQFLVLITNFGLKLPKIDCKNHENSMSSMLWATTAASFLGLAYVGGLYVWRSEHDRDHPETIKRRFLSAFFTSCICPPLGYVFGNQALLQEHGLAAIIGVRGQGFLAATTVPLALTMVLFLGPICMLVTNERFKWMTHYSYWYQCSRDWVWWRNHVVAPFTEEFAFRACMVPILLSYYSPRFTVFMSPLFFGIAHFHHMIERIRRGQDLKTALLISTFQFAYTTVFGIYSAFYSSWTRFENRPSNFHLSICLHYCIRYIFSFLFIRTGHLASCVIVHGFCNFMGFPDLLELYQQEAPKRWILSAFFLLGLGLFYFGLLPATDNDLYLNSVYQWHSINILKQ